MASNFSDQILRFFSDLKQPGGLPDDVNVLWPYSQPEVKKMMSGFYRKFYSDDRPRVFLIGINPGRFGAGLTGIGFTDPDALRRHCGIDHPVNGKKELSSDFIYRMIAACGGVREFFSRFYITSVSPAGFTRQGRNLNYYDFQAPGMEDWMATAMENQTAAGTDRTVAFSIGQGENFRRLKDFNKRHGFFDRIEALPHPRWVMQYRRREVEKWIRVYTEVLGSAADKG